MNYSPVSLRSLSDPSSEACTRCLCIFEVHIYKNVHFAKQQKKKAAVSEGPELHCHDLLSGQSYHTAKIWSLSIWIVLTKAAQVTFYKCVNLITWLWSGSNPAETSAEAGSKWPVWSQPICLNSQTLLSPLMTLPPHPAVGVGGMLLASTESFTESLLILPNKSRHNQKRY